MKFYNKLLCLTILLMSGIFSNAQELIIGEERIEPGIVVIFEGGN